VEKEGRRAVTDLKTTGGERGGTSPPIGWTTGKQVSKTAKGFAPKTVGKREFLKKKGSHKTWGRSDGNKDPTGKKKWGGQKTEKQCQFHFTEGKAAYKGGRAPTGTYTPNPQELPISRKKNRLEILKCRSGGGRERLLKTTVGAGSN